ncbi:Frizzled-4 [Aphelenchoides besseyi]|nr:Frizzled-4 [Aphelenchoides besseyi]KAI6210413.1 Frizzled-4 [Aphelenchoides besseyi]
MILLLFLLFIVPIHGQRQRCVPIKTPQCAQIGYNSTRFPNFVLSDLDERAAVDEFKTFEPLISIGCSDELRFFLCASYFPLCNEKIPDSSVGPCRPLCRRVKSQCTGVLKEFGFPWPQNLDCDKFVEVNNEETMCMPGPKGHDPETPTQQTSLCQKNHVYMNRTAICVPKCQNAEKQSTLIVASILSFVLTSVCLLSSCFGEKKSPLNVTLFYSAFCFAFCAIVYFISILQSDRIACFSYLTHELFVIPGISHVPCTFVAALLYFFGTAGRLWWLSACFAWRWQLRNTNQNSQKLSKFLYNLHVSSWSISFVLLTIALMAQAAEADPLSGFCLIGAVGRSNFTMFVLLRDFAVILISTFIITMSCLQNSKIGVVCAILPVGQTFWFLASVQHIYFDEQLGVGSWAKLLADPSLGALMGAAFLFGREKPQQTHQLLPKRSFQPPNQPPPPPPIFSQ